MFSDIFNTGQSVKFLKFSYELKNYITRIERFSKVFNFIPIYPSTAYEWLELCVCDGLASVTTAHAQGVSVLRDLFWTLIKPGLHRF